MRAVARRAVPLIAVLSVAGLLVGCSEEPAVPPSTEARAGVGEVTTGADGVQEITLQTQDDYVFTPDSFTVEPGRVRLTLINVGEQMVHNFRFTPDTGPVPIDAEIDILPAGEEETVEFEVAEPGEYPFACSFHIQLDQLGTMPVAGWCPSSTSCSSSWRWSSRSRASGRGCWSRPPRSSASSAGRCWAPSCPGRWATASRDRA